MSKKVTENSCACLGKKQVHITDVNGNDVQINHLCQTCATNFFAPQSSKEELVMPQEPKNPSTKPTVCPNCGAPAFNAIANPKIGCANCYHTFKDELQDTLTKIQADTKHVGKKPKNAPSIENTVNKTIEKENKEEKISKLQKEMQAAIQIEDYEAAAKLRDQIKSLQ